MNFQASVLVFSTLVAFSYQSVCTNQTKQELCYGDLNCVYSGGNVYSASLTFDLLPRRGSGVFLKIRSIIDNSYVELTPNIFLLDGPPHFCTAVTQTPNVTMTYSFAPFKEEMEFYFTGPNVANLKVDFNIYSCF